jgi:hypothetical protein
MSGAPDPLYIAARRVLLDALEALADHRDALVLVGAQAVYMHTGEADLAVAPYTTDADLAIDPRRLGDEPLLEDALTSAGFEFARPGAGAWTKPVMVGDSEHRMVVDFLVPPALGGPGRRGARIPPHAVGAARKARGIEGAFVDLDELRVTSLDRADTRAYDVAVAGSAALLVAKTIKVGERADRSDRTSDKDALDVLRLLRAISSEELVRRFALLRANDDTSTITADALAQMAYLFASPRGLGATMAARALSPFEPEDTVRASIAALTRALLDALGDRP